MVSIHYKDKLLSRFIAGCSNIEHIQDKIDRNKEKIIKARLKMTGTVSIKQYKELFGEEAYITKNIKSFVIEKVRERKRYTRYKILEDVEKSVFIYVGRRNYVNHILHQYTIIEFIINTLKKNTDKLDISKLYFDKSFSYKYSYFRDKNVGINKNIAPDGVIISGNYGTAYFLEIDMGTGSQKIMLEKAYSYKRLFEDFMPFKIDKWRIGNVKLLLHATPNRITSIKKHGRFNCLKNDIQYVPVNGYE